MASLTLHGTEGVVMGLQLPLARIFDRGEGSVAPPPRPSPPDAPELCGINPVTGEPGIIPRESGQAGQLRPGEGGRGVFLAPRQGGRTHQGLDIAGPIGGSISASYGGTVIFAGEAGGYGNMVVVDIGRGYTMRYSHLDTISVSRGQVLTTGGVLGTLGQTGNAAGQPASEAHLHFEIRNGGRAVDPRNFLNSICPW